MTAPAAVPAPAATRPVGVVRTKTHQYYFSGAGPWPGVTAITKVLDAPALTHWKMNQVAQAAIAGAERLIEPRDECRCGLRPLLLQRGDPVLNLARLELANEPDIRRSRHREERGHECHQ